MDTGNRGSWNLENVRFYRPGSIQSWSIVSSIEREVALRQGESGLPAFTDALMDMLESMGMQLPSDYPPLLHQGSATTDDVLKEAIREAQETYKEPPNLILFLLPNKSTTPHRIVHLCPSIDVCLLQILDLILRSSVLLRANWVSSHSAS